MREEYTLARGPLISNALLPPAVKRMELIEFSGPKLSFGRSDSAECEQRGAK